MSLDVADLTARLRTGCDAIIAAEDILSEADRAIGDGDHGVAMARGFSAAAEALANSEPDNAAEVFRRIGMAVLSKSGGACGAIFGTFFLGTAKALPADPGPADVLAAMGRGLDDMKARGGAAEGDKTVIDALAPALREADKATGSLDELFKAMARGAKSGAQATCDMRAATGKARSLGERSVGFVDPGALSMSTFLTAAAGGAAP